jgi:hypothetical protein
MRVFALVAMVVASPAFADSEQWPDGPNKRFFQTLERPDAWKGANAFERSCCGHGDIIKTKFKVEPGGGEHPQDTWSAWLQDKWVEIPDRKIVPGHAPDGQAYLFVMHVRSDDFLGAVPAYNVILCFVRPRGGL